MLDGGIASGPISAGAIGAIVSTTLKISTIVYELKAVGEQTRDLLDSTQHVSNNLQTARTLRRQKSVHFDSNEKKWIDSVLISTDKTLSNVAALIEPARVDLQTKFGNVSLLNRGLFVFRDSPKVQTHLARLSIASGSLDTVLNVLCAREGRLGFLSPKIEDSHWPDAAKMRRRSAMSLRSEASGPPAYQDSEPFQPQQTLLATSRQQPVSGEIEKCVVEDLPTDFVEEFLCTASWGASPTLPSTYTALEGSYVLSPNTLYPKTGPIIEIQELPQSRSSQRYSGEPSARELCSRVSNTSTLSVNTIRTRKSVSSIRSSTSTLASDTSRFSIVPDAASKASGRQRGLAWMAHQVGR